MRCRCGGDLEIEMGIYNEEEAIEIFKCIECNEKTRRDHNRYDFGKYEAVHPEIYFNVPF